MTVSCVLPALVSFGSHGWWQGWGPGGWGWLWGPIVLLLWAAAIATVGWVVVRAARPRERPGVDRAREILAERYARGELTTEEYRERLEQLQ